jgi:ankyrin repeat protein
LIEKGANLYDVEEGGLTPLEFCCLGDHRDLFTILNNNYYSQKKLDEINQYNDKHISLIHLAATSKAGVKILSELCKDRSNINSQCKHYLSTPLHFAVLEKNIPAIEVLLRCEAFIDAKDYNGNTPIHFATELGNIQILRILFTYGANIHIKNNSGMSAYNIAITQENKEVQLFYMNSANVKNNSYTIQEEDFMFKKSAKFN